MMVIEASAVSAASVRCTNNDTGSNSPVATTQQNSFRCCCCAVVSHLFNSDGWMNLQEARRENCPPGGNNHAESTPLVQNDRNVLSGDKEGETLTTTKASATMTTIRRSATVRFVMLLLSATSVVLVVLGTSKTTTPTTATATTTSSKASMVALLKDDQSYGDVVGAPTLPPLFIPTRLCDIYIYQKCRRYFC